MAGQTRINGETLVDRVCEFSRFARSALETAPTLRAWLASESASAWRTPWPEVTNCRSPDALATALRATRHRLMLHTIARDVSGAANFEEIVGSVTSLAKWSIPAARNWHAKALAREYGTPVDATTRTVAQSLITVGMGKLGGQELNVSSDIDLIFTFPDDGQTVGKRGASSIDNAHFFAKLAQRMSATLGEVRGDGFVFRVDTRLRPYGDEGPLAVSFDFLERYLVEQGRFWERLAWLRSASMTGELSARKQLSAMIRPFVYRRYVDYDAYEGLRDLHGKIRAEGHRNGGERNVKLGRGGIRELEFFVQVQQLVRGGRAPALQLRTTIPAIAALEAAHVFTPAQAQGLRDAYPFLRRVEHFLQYENDAQTQILPNESADLCALAHAMGFASEDEFAGALTRTRTFVAAQFDNLAQSQPTAGTISAANPAAQISEFSGDSSAAFAGFNAPEEAQRYFQALRTTQKFATLPATSQARMRTLLAALPATCAASAAPLAALKRWGDLLEAICGRSAYLALLAEHAALLTPITRVLAASGWAAEFLRDHPILLDELLDARSRNARFDPIDALLRLQSQLTAATDTEAKLDTLRRFQQTALFGILLEDLDGRRTIEALSDDLSALADVVVEAALQEIWREIAPQFAFPKFAVIAYGRWGGKELGYGSDLDLVFLVNDDVRFDLCAKLAQRLQSWLTTTTTAGQLYEIDTRLRPDGASGMLLTGLTAFNQYQTEKAWLWEHQALSRARFAAGDAQVGTAFEAIRKKVLQTPKSAPQVLTEINAMRARMASEKAKKSAGFDVKNDPGGMVDIEFIVQALVLLHAPAHPFLIENKGNIALLNYAAATGLLKNATAAIPAAQISVLSDIYRHYRAFQHQARLAGLNSAIAAAEDFSAQRAQVRAAWQHVLG